MARPGFWQGHITQPGDPADYAAMQPLCALDRYDGARIEVVLDIRGDARQIVAVGDEGHGRFHCVMECPLADDEQVARQATRFIEQAQADTFRPMGAWRARVTAADIRRAVDAARAPAHLGHGDVPVRTLSEALFS